LFLFEATCFRSQNNNEASKKKDAGQTAEIQISFLRKEA